MIPWVPLVGAAICIIVGVGYVSYCDLPKCDDFCRQLIMLIAGLGAGFNLGVAAVRWNSYE